MPARSKSGDGSVLAAAVEAQHPDPFRAISRETLFLEAARVDELSTNDRSVLTVELMRMLTLLGPRNGHTAVHPPLDDGPVPRRAYPLGLYECTDGVFVTAAERSDLIGSELVAINGTDIDEVLRAVTPLIAHDNDWTIRARRPAFVVNASVLRGLGVIDDDRPAQFLLRSQTGSRSDLVLGPIGLGEYLAWLGDGDSVAKTHGPTYLRRRTEFHWTELTADDRAVHVGYNVTLGPIEEFAYEVEALAARPHVRLVVLDLRHNGGGDNRTYGPLLKALERVGDTKRLAVLTSRASFSAAMQLVVDLERSTQATFVGEPTGGSPNSYGDATTVELPNSGLSAFVATIAWTTAGEADERLTREPDIAVLNDSRALFTDRDQTLDVAMAALS